MITSDNLEVERALAEKRLGDAVVAFVKAHQYVTFVELESLLEEHMPIKGHWAFVLGGHPTAILWGGVSREFYDIVSELMQAKRLYHHSTSAFIYMIDGGAPRLPVATTARALQSKKEYWVPICFCTYPYVSKKGGRSTRGATTMGG